VKNYDIFCEDVFKLSENRENDPANSALEEFYSDLKRIENFNNLSGGLREVQNILIHCVDVNWDGGE
jgi:hypothetical protein